MELTIVPGDDWIGVYIGGELKYEGHELHYRDLLNLLKIPFNTVYPNLDWLYSVGRLPERLKEVLHES